jgi:hypothetical protein
VLLKDGLQTLCALKVSQSSAGSTVIADADHSLVNLRSRSESGATGRYRAYGLRDPASPFPEGPATRSSLPVVACGWV